MLSCFHGSSCNLLLAVHGTAVRHNVHVAGAASAMFHPVLANSSSLLPQKHSAMVGLCLGCAARNEPHSAALKPAADVF